MTSALALARHRLVNERRDGPRWAEALREGAAMKRSTAWPSRYEFSQMTPREVNQFFASRGVDVRVRE